MTLEELQQSEWLEPWATVSGNLEAQELANEVSPGHPLFRVQAVAVARDDDDVLFWLSNHKPELAVVHLTYKSESNPQWPHTDFYESFAEFQARMQEDYHQYTREESDAG